MNGRRLHSALVVEDNLFMAGVIASMLEALGFSRIDHAFDGSDALLHFRHHRYTHLITDVGMQPVDGISLVQALRERGETDLRIIVASGTSTTTQLVQAMRAGANAYLVKPFKIDALRARLDGPFVPNDLCADGTDSL